MGSLNHFNLPQLIEEFDLRTFIETGTARAHGLLHALTFPFERLYSIESDLELYDYCVDKFFSTKTGKFKDERLRILHNTSKEGLEEIFLCYPIVGNILFWSDAHYINAASCGTPETFNSGKEELRYPLESELRVIKKHREGFRDVFILDDWRIYEEGGYETGNLPSYINRPLNSGIGFVEELFGDSHNISRDFSAEGYLILTPK